MRNLVLINKVFLCKWSLRLALDREAFWRQVIGGKYGEEKDGWRSCEVRERFGVDLLKAIRREWDMVDGNMVFSMGNERKVRFW